MFRSQSNDSMPLRQPFSVLVVIYNSQSEFLLIQRADDPTFWQSVTGGIDEGETPLETAHRELLEETGIDAHDLGLVIRDHQETNRYEIRPEWRHRYGDDVLFNTEHVFSICVPEGTQVRLNPAEHLDYVWLSQEQAADKAWSWSNAKAILAIE